LITSIPAASGPGPIQTRSSKQHFVIEDFLAFRSGGAGRSEAADAYASGGCAAHHLSAHPGHASRTTHHLGVRAAHFRARSRIIRSQPAPRGDPAGRGAALTADRTW